ncbi:MAG: cytochrome c oxidase subunit 3 [Tunicatimonas sp.]
MQNQNKNTQKASPQNVMDRLEKLHPHKTLLYLAIFGSCLLFGFLITAYAVKTDHNTFINFRFPKSFIVSLVLLLFSSFSISKALGAFRDDDMEALKQSLGLTLLLGLGFTISQYVGWYELNQSKIYLSGEVSGSYLYIISGLHVLHLAAGLVFLTVTYTHVSNVSRDQVKRLIMVTNPYQRIKLEMLTVYWHFVDILWVVLFFYFLFSF